MENAKGGGGGVKGLYDFLKRHEYTKSFASAVAGNLSHLTGLCGLMLAIAGYSPVVAAICPL